MRTGRGVGGYVRRIAAGQAAMPRDGGAGQARELKQRAGAALRA
ncbi:hypothetical protein N7E70_013950 [Aminobacter sp. NyZ550]|nr:hypothetical protein [Aminobacter sp. NyZ550]WAX92820.1 hypothetical protein N7E70_013950 [Aminobacter sp. NyZ550]WMC95056.1 hypothetical protein RAR13_16880 [Aminobacter aminovorans]